METKVCTKYGRELPLDKFSKRSRGKDGLSPCCKDCANKYMREWYVAKKNATTEEVVTPEPVKERVLSDYTPRELMAELKRKGYEIDSQGLYVLEKRYVKWADIKLDD